MKNILGHDNESEISTLIARLRENKFSILLFDNNSIKFEIDLEFKYVVPIPYSRNLRIKYIITRYGNNGIYNYHFNQLNGIPNRLISFIDGNIIWGLLDEFITH